MNLRVIVLSAEDAAGGTDVGNDIVEVRQDVEGSKYQPLVFFRSVPTPLVEPLQTLVKRVLSANDEGVRNASGDSVNPTSLPPLLPTFW